MAKSKNNSKKDPYAIEIGERLRCVIDAYYGTQARFAKASSLGASMVSEYTNGERLLTNKVAMNLQKTISINKDYLLTGDLPIFLDSNIKPLKDVQMATTADKRRQEVESTALIERNLIPYSSMLRQGLNGEMHLQEPKSIINILINGLKEPQAIRVTDAKFIEKYVQVYQQLTMNCIIVVSTIFMDGNVVMLKSGRDYRIAVLDKGKYYDVVPNNEEIKNVAKEDIVGRLYGIYVVI